MTNDEVSTEQASINDYRRLEAFLADPAVKRAIETVDADITKEFKESATPSQRESAWAKSQGLQKVCAALMATMENGKLALALREKRERDAEQRARVNTRIGRKP